MSDTIWDINYDLRAWAEWSNYQSGIVKGYPTVQPFRRMLGEGVSNISDYAITDDYAQIVDRAVANLKPLNADLYCLIDLYYLHHLTQQEVAKKLNCSTATVKQKLDVARQVVKGMVWVLQQPAANDSK